MGLRLLGGLRRFVGAPLSPPACRQTLATQRARRADTFVRLFDQGIFAVPDNPYCALLSHAGVSPGDIRALVRTEGVEGTLKRLHACGVWLSEAEFKGRAPIRRGSLVLTPRPHQFDNPIAARHFESATGGSRGHRTRFTVDLDLLTHEAACLQLFVEAWGLDERPEALWWAVPPGSAGLKNTLRRAKLGQPVRRWFSPYPLSWRPAGLKAAVFTSLVVGGSRLLGCRLSFPQHVPVNEASRVAEWLAANTRRSTPAILATTPSGAVRVCEAARLRRLSIQGAFFRVTGEPYTRGKARVIEQAGCRAAPFYSMAEMGYIGLPCVRGQQIDDMHLLDDRVALIQRPVDTRDGQVDGLLLTTLHPAAPRIMINVVNGDYATVEHRPDCGCAIGAAGYAIHLSNLRSYDKLTSNGVCFVGDELQRLVDDVLPSCFGGTPTDYQFVEREQAGESRVDLLVDPRVGPVDSRQVVETVYRVLEARKPAGPLMVAAWREAGTLGVAREPARATAAAKTLPLHAC